MMNTDVVAARASTVKADAGRQVFLLFLLSLSAVLRVYAISIYPLVGDEYGSIAEAKTVGLNWNSILYSGLMHLWIRLGSSELWLRLPAAIFGTATVVILFKVGERLGGWRTGVVAGLLAATSPFNIYHSQEVRFYSLFMCASAAFMLATIYYLDSSRTARARAGVLVTGFVLLFSHFLGVLALFAQGGATVLAAESRWSKRTLLLVTFGLPNLALILLLVPGIPQRLWHLYQVFGNAPTSSDPAMTPASVFNLLKITFAGFVFVFGYHVYPFRLVPVIVGASLSGFLLLVGIRRLWKETHWKVLPFAYLLTLLIVYVVLDSVGGRVASGVAPRHVAFVWPVFLILIAMGLATFAKPAFYFLLVAALGVNGLSVCLGWQKDWSYNQATDYRSAAEFESKWATPETAILHDGRSKDAISFYFPKETQLIDSWSYVEGKNTKDLLGYQRLVFITDDWELRRRQGFDQLLRRLNDDYEYVDGRVDYPLFEYVLQRKRTSTSAGDSFRRESNQIIPPLSIYGLEFQDLQLPVSVKLQDVPLSVIGAYGLPNLDRQKVVTISLAGSHLSKRLMLVTNVFAPRGLNAGQEIAEVLVEDKAGDNLAYPLRLGRETESWDKRCAGPCETVFLWHKRIAIVGQNRYQGALRDFQAGLHGMVFDFPKTTNVVRLTIRYVANAGQLYVWALALPEN
jgi:hypothetical protein